MKAKARLRDRVKAKKGMGLSLGDSLVSICCMGIGLTPLNIGEISYAALGKIIDRYQKKEAYETDIQSILAGADAKKIHPKYWITKNRLAMNSCDDEVGSEIGTFTPPIA